MEQILSREALETAFDKDLSEVMGQVVYVQKLGENEGQRYTYARAADVIGRVNQGLAERGISVSSSSELLRYDSTETEGRNGPRLRIDAVVKLRLTFQRGPVTRTVEGVGASMDNGDKAVMKANTAALKYALASGFLISWGDDPEADPVSDEMAKDAPAKKGRGRGAKTAPADEEPSKEQQDLLAEVASSIRAAKTVPELEAVKEKARQLSGVARTEAGTMYVERMAQLVPSKDEKEGN